MRIIRASLFCRSASAPPAQSWSVDPAIVGTPTVGTAAACTAGTYSGTASYTYQWTLDGANISGATSATYTPVSGDATHTLRRVTTPTDGGPASTTAGVVVAAAGGSSTILIQADLPQLQADGSSASAPAGIFIDYDKTTKTPFGGYAYTQYFPGGDLSTGVTLTGLDASTTYFFQIRLSYDGTTGGKPSGEFSKASTP